MRCWDGGKIYVLHTSGAIEQEQTIKTRKKITAKTETDSGDNEKNKEIHVNLEMCSASWHPGWCALWNFTNCVKKKKKTS